MAMSPTCILILYIILSSFFTIIHLSFNLWHCTFIRPFFSSISYTELAIGYIICATWFNCEAGSQNEFHCKSYYSTKIGCFALLDSKSHQHNMHFNPSHKTLER